MNYTFTVTQQEMQIIAQTLAQLPYGQVAPLVAKLQQQVNETDNANAMHLSTGDWESACRNLLPAEEFARIKAAAG